MVIASSSSLLLDLLGQLLPSFSNISNIWAPAFCPHPETQLRANLCLLNHLQAKTQPRVVTDFQSGQNHSQRTLTTVWAAVEGTKMLQRKLPKNLLEQRNKATGGKQKEKRNLRERRYFYGTGKEQPTVTTAKLCSKQQRSAFLIMNTWTWKNCIFK